MLYDWLMTNETHINHLANKLLDNARADRPHDRAIGVALQDVPGYGNAVVSWDHITKTYEVGTEAKVEAKGRRGAVLPALLEVLRRATKPWPGQHMAGCDWIGCGGCS